MKETLVKEPKLDLKIDDYKMIIDGLEALKSAGLAGEMMGDMMALVLEKKTKDMSPTELEAKRQRDDEAERKKIEKRIAKEELSRKIDVLKSKVILAQDEALEAAVSA